MLNVAAVRRIHGVSPLFVRVGKQPASSPRPRAVPMEDVPRACDAALSLPHPISGVGKEAHLTTAGQALLETGAGLDPPGALHHLRRVDAGEADGDGSAATEGQAAIARATDREVRPPSGGS